MPERPFDRADPAKILLVEDEIAIAVLIEEELKEAGYEVVGPAASVEAAAKHIAETRIDAAVLDINLSGRSVHEILEPLVERRVPFVFMTGYEELELPAWVPPVPRFAKPFHVPDLVALLPDLIRRSRSRPGAQ
jgi:DNA-binding NtrC family response regulator